MRRTKIVCTIGPATSTDEKLGQLMEAGMNVARLNCSHGTTAERLDCIRRIRAAAERHGRPIAVFLDLRGPRLRMGRLPPEGRRLQAGEDVLLATEGAETAGLAGAALPVQSPFLAAGVSAGQSIFVDDGNVELSVSSTDGVAIRCRVVRGGRLTSHKGINAPGAHLALPILEPEDLVDLQAGIREGIDAVAVSFVRHEEDLRQVRAAVHAFRPGLPLIAKMETSQALERLDPILDESEAVMVARGDLGVEMPIERVPLIQKRLIALARARGKPVITATQMLESMVEQERPTRAEASDVANAVLDGTDAVMLSAETSVGRYPVQAVQVMDRIIGSVESESMSRGADGGESSTPPDSALAVSKAACHAAATLAARAVVVFTQSGSTAAAVSRCRPVCPIAAFTPSPEVCRWLNFTWGVVSQTMPLASTLESMIPEMELRLRASRMAGPGDTVVLVAGSPVELRPRANFLKVHTLP
ncbi:MAG: pyruvate kinase [Planctomycetes bacterium]|nr:pyruvate kinase [Planctomycetota bacterium]